MNKREKKIREDKKDIAKRLRWSDRELWASLSEEQRTAIVDEYYDLSSIEHVGIYKVLEDNRNATRSLAILAIGALFGITGGVAGNVLFEYFPKEISIFLTVIFVFLVGFIIYQIDRTNAERLGEDRVLEYLVASIRKEGALRETE